MSSLQAIIDQSQEPDEEDGEGETAESPADAPDGAGNSPRGTKRKVKTERSQEQSKAVKVELQSSRPQSSTGESDVIDLT